jgi:hypothetical protein
MQPRGLLLLSLLLGVVDRVETMLLEPIDVTAGEQPLTLRRIENTVTVELRNDAEGVYVRFEADSTLDDIVGTATFAYGQGPSYSLAAEAEYVTITDERGVWFTGGMHRMFDDSPSGGDTLDSPFSFGSEGEGCGGFHVQVAFDDGNVDLGGDGADGTLDGVAVHAVGVGAERHSFFAATQVDDGWGPGFHSTSNIIAYAWRRTQDAS